LTLLPAAQAARAGFVYAAASLVLITVNARLNLFKDGLKAKYPMSYIPEAVLAGLTLVGAYVLYL